MNARTWSDAENKLCRIACLLDTAVFLRADGTWIEGPLGKIGFNGEGLCLFRPGRACERVKTTRPSELRALIGHPGRSGHVVRERGPVRTIMAYEPPPRPKRKSPR